MPCAVKCGRFRPGSEFTLDQCRSCWMDQFREVAAEAIPRRDWQKCRFLGKQFPEQFFP